MRLFIHAGKVVNPIGDSIAGPATIVVEGGLIADVLAGHAGSPETGDVVDWRAWTVIPGLVSCHEHVTLDSTGPKYAERDVETMTGIRAVGICREFLRQGVTTVRDAGAQRAVNIRVKRAMLAGLFDGPDLVVAGHRIARTGFAKAGVCLAVDGADNLRQAVRREAQDGAEFIKLMVSGVVSGGGSPYDPQYSAVEIQAAVDEAHELGLKVAVHAYGGAGASRAIAAGADTIEHGASLCKADIATMASNGSCLVVTYDAINATAVSPTAPGHLRSKAQSMIDAYAVTLPAARQAGIKVAVGGDGHGFRPAAEASALAASGFTAAETLAALTINGAEICGLSDKGQVRTGCVADLVALAADPLLDLATLASVQGVIKGGKLLTDR